MPILGIMKHLYYFLFITASLFLLGACTAHKNTSSSNTPAIDPEDKEEESHTKPQIIFMNFELTKQDDNSIKAELINTIITEGTIKKKQYGKEMKKGDVVCKGLNKDKKVIQSISYDNPMLKTVEYVNDEGQLEKKQVSLEQAQLTIRMQLNHNTKSISLEQIDPSGSILLTAFEIEPK